MSRIALLHPQCSQKGGAIQMALQTVRVLQDQGHTVTLYTFEHSPDCFPELQEGVDIVIWPEAHIKKEKSIIRHSSFVIRHFCHKCFKIATLGWHLRHFDMVIANNPPMQIVAALAKAFSIKIKYKGRKGRNDENEGMIEDNKREAHNYSLFILHYSLSSLRTVWWHHHVPWYLPKGMKEGRNEGMKGEGARPISQIGKKILHFRHYLHYSLFIACKSFLERLFVIPLIDEMVATSHFVAEKIHEYCGRDSVVVHPVIMNNEDNEAMKQGRETIQFPSFRHSVIPSLDRVTLFTHGRLEEGKGLDMLIRVFGSMKNEEGIMNNGGIQLIIFGTGSLESKLQKEGIDVRPFAGQETFSELSTGQYGHVIGVYCSSIDAFGMASLESQLAGFSTLIIDSGGAREAILSDDHDDAVGRLVHSEEELSAIISHYVQNKTFPKPVSNVNFSHTRDYFSPARLSSDILSLMSKTSL